jgi:hypothetical protein
MTEQPTKYNSAIHHLEITLNQIKERITSEDGYIERNRDSIKECEKNKSILRIQQKEIEDALKTLKESDKK